MMDMGDGMLSLNGGASGAEKEHNQLPNGVEGLRTEVRLLRKELQTLNACFNSSTAKLTALHQQHAQACDLLSRQGEQIQVCQASLSGFLSTLMH